MKRFVALVAALMAGGFGEARAQDITQYVTQTPVVMTSIAAGPGNYIWVGAQGNVMRMNPVGGFEFFPMLTNRACTFTNGDTFADRDPENVGAMTVGPDGATWFTMTRESAVVRIAVDGGISRLVLGSGCVDLNLGELAGGVDGNIWVTERKTNKIARVTSAGVVTEFAVPTTDASPHQMVAGPDGNVWFSEDNKNAVGRVTPAGVITEFATPSHPGNLAAGPDGNVWYTVDGTSPKVGKITSYGTITEYPLVAGSGATSINGITAGPDGNMWVTATNFTTIPDGAGSGGSTTQVLTSRLMRVVTASGQVAVYNHPTPEANPGKITSYNGNLYFVQIGQLVASGVVNAGQTTGASRVGRMTPPEYLTPTHIAAVFSTSQSATQSYIRIVNTGAAAGTAKLTLSDPATGAALATYTTPPVAPNSAPQVGIATIEAAATSSFTKPAYYVLTVESSMTGYLQHVLYRPADGTLTNLSSCDRGVMLPASQAANVHTRLLNSGFPSSIVLYNGGLTATTVALGIYNANDGTSLGTYTTASIAVGGELIVPASTIEGALASVPAGLYHYVIKVNSNFTGTIQHLVTNNQAGVITDMTNVCSLKQ